MRDGRIHRPANDSCERGGLGEGQLCDGFAEIVFRRRFETVVSRAQVNLIAVHRENLVFGVVALDFDGENRLLHFAVKAAVGAIQEEAAGELHRQSAGAFLDLMMADVVPGGLEDAREIDAPVFFEVLVFGGEDRVLQMSWESGRRRAGCGAARRMCRWIAHRRSTARSPRSGGSLRARGSLANRWNRRTAARSRRRIQSSRARERRTPGAQTASHFQFL